MGEEEEVVKEEEVVEQIIETILRIQLQNRTPTIPVVDDNKVEDVVKTDKEVIAEEEKELIENEKTDEPEKTEEVKEEEEKTEPKKVHLLQKLFGKRKDFVVPKIDEVAKTDWRHSCGGPRCGRQQSGGKG